MVQPVVLPALDPADIETWVAQAEQASPAIRQARLGLEVARLETQKAKAGHKPTVDLSASRSDERNPATTTTVFSDLRTVRTQYAINFNMPLFAGFATQNRVRETLALEDRAQVELDNARRTTEQAVRTAYLALVSGNEKVRALEAAEASSQSSFEANRVGFQAGIRINIDVLNAQSQLFQTRRDLALARYGVLVGHLRLRQAAGTLGPEDVLALDSRLAK
jgi:outer membrane protein